MSEDRILVVEDSKTLGKLLCLKLENELGVKVDLAETMKDAELLASKESYLLATLDLVLPDAHNGEIVDTMLSFGIPSIVLTARLEKDIRDKFLKKGIIDYVFKESVEDINYVVRAIKRLLLNRKHTILIVEDSATHRLRLEKLTKNLFFNTLAVENGREALDTLNSHKDIKIVITDYNMPLMDGLELTKEIRKRYCRNEIAILVFSSNEDSSTSAIFLKRGADDYIYKTVSQEEFGVRLNNIIESMENIETITNMACKDFLTSLYNRRYFFDEGYRIYVEAMQKKEPVSIAVLDIDKFKSINDNYGHDVGDIAIKEAARVLSESLDKEGAVVSRFGGEEFCVLWVGADSAKVIATYEHIREIFEKNIIVKDSLSFSYTVSIGVYFPKSDTLDESVKKADENLYRAKDGGRNRIVH